MSSTPEELTVQEFAAWRRQPDSYHLLDVREPWELAICRFDESIAIPLQQLPGRLAEIPHDRPLVVHCHHGMRSAQAVAWLRRNGLGDAVNLEGGIDAWAREVDPTMGVY
jgi:rhodanese-related sulfurtransferase